MTFLCVDRHAFHHYLPRQLLPHFANLSLPRRPPPSKHQAPLASLPHHYHHHYPFNASTPSPSSDSSPHHHHHHYHNTIFTFHHRHRPTFLPLPSSNPYTHDGLPQIQSSSPNSNSSSLLKISNQATSFFLSLPFFELSLPIFSLLFISELPPLYSQTHLHIHPQNQSKGMN